MKLLVAMAGVYCFILNSVISFRESMRRLQEAETRLWHSNRDQPAKFSSDFWVHTASQAEGSVVYVRNR